MDDEGHLLQVQVRDQLLQVGDVLLEQVVPVLRLVAQAAADVVWDDHSEFTGEALDQCTPIEGPGGVSMHGKHHRRVPGALVQVVERAPVDLKGVAIPRVESPHLGRKGAHHSTLIIATFSPLPMPIIARVSPREARPSSSVFASANGTAAAPTFPISG